MTSDDNVAIGQASLCGKVGKRQRAVVVPRFGRRLKGLREDADFSQQKVVNGVVGRFGLKFDRSSLAQWEAGTVAGPDAALLWALATFFGESTSRLAYELANERGRLDLSIYEPTREVIGAESHTFEDGGTPADSPDATTLDDFLGDSMKELPDRTLLSGLVYAWTELLHSTEARRRFVRHCVAYAASMPSSGVTGTEGNE